MSYIFYQLFLCTLFIAIATIGCSHNKDSKYTPQKKSKIVATAAPQKIPNNLVKTSSKKGGNNILTQHDTRKLRGILKGQVVGKVKNKRVAFNPLVNVLPIPRVGNGKKIRRIQSLDRYSNNKKIKDSRTYYSHHI